ncbi:receiver/sensor box histidine kinase [Halorussus halobius]|uniref:receiver/sensor box histidine kinase n=1 Tax=Halorussus halobius TaxID=1710537 RepID=UPI0010919952|nr:HAMP domain-containing sensor histidine kinase [Halorussus halobius]
MLRLSSRVVGAFIAAIGALFVAVHLNDVFGLQQTPARTAISAAPLAASLLVVTVGVAVADERLVPPEFVGRVLAWTMGGGVAIAAFDAWIFAGVLARASTLPTTVSLFGVAVPGVFAPLFDVIPFGVLTGFFVGVYDVRRLAQQRSIAQLSRINETLRIATQEMVELDDRETLEQVVCDRLAESDPYEGVWVGRYHEADDVVQPAAWAGLPDDYVESIVVTVDESETGDGAGGRAIRTGEVQTVPDVYADPSMEPWWELLERHGFESLAVVPIVHADTVYGFLSIYADRQNVFDERETEVLSEVGESLGHAIASIEMVDLLATRERELARQNERLAEFATVVSHDLRNPLNVADGFLDIAQESGDEADFERVRDALDRMDSLIEDLLTLARQGEAVDEFETVDLAAVVADAWEVAGAESATLHTPDDLGTVACDPSRLRQLFENLFRNARQHGGADVTVTVGVLDDTGFYVADDGPGIPEAEREQVFDVGYTTHDEGTGFGLNIVDDIASAHGWNLGLAESDAGGARFEFRGVEGDVARLDEDDL